jgi:carbon starvation protein
VLAPAKSLAEMQRVAFNNYLDAAVCSVFVVLVVVMCFFALRMGFQAWRQSRPTVHESPYMARPQEAH